MVLSRFELTGKVAIITGGGIGIGKSIALALSEAGASVVIAEIDAGTGKATADEIAAAGRKALALCTDARDRQQVNGMVEKAVKEFGRIDILVNNVGGVMINGTPRAAPVLEMSEDVWDAVVTLNLKTTWLCSRAVAPVMRRQEKGCIINIASIAGMVPYPTMAHYGAAKAGIINLTRTLMLEWAPYNIRVNAVAPGSIETPPSREFYRTRTELRDDRLKRIPLGHRWGRPEEIASTVVYLASEAASYVTGETILVGGGLTSIGG